jgi:hypothetical protein
VVARVVAIGQQGVAVRGDRRRRRGVEMLLKAALDQCLKIAVGIAVVMQGLRRMPANLSMKRRRAEELRRASSASWGFV